jgi:glutamate carboxypeptidase
LCPMSARWLSVFESDLPRLVGDLETLVCLESPSDDAVRVTRLAAWVHDRLRERGVPSELRPCPPRGDALLASVAFREGGTLLLGHLDTVWPVGTLADMPWRLDGGRAAGPGVFDMKAGAVVGMAVLTAMVRESRPHPVSLLLVPDEEAGSGASRELTLSVARRHRRVLVLEPSADGAAKVARKGCGVFHVRFSGRAAHAGLEPERGASALAELARFVLFLEAVAAPAKGTTLTATVARSGSATNVVPETAELDVDARAWTLDESERVSAATRGYRAFDPGVSVAVDGGFDRPPLESTTASEALYATARRLAGDLGLELGAARVGGGSDGNFTAAAGIPTLDGLGPLGGGAHARDEHVLVADLPRRAALVAALVSEP